MNVRLKFYSCVGSTHSTLDTVAEMRERHPFAPGDVAKIVIHTSEITLHHVGWKYVPQGVTAAQLNVSYCVATLLLEGACFVDQFTVAMLADPARMALAAKIETHEDPAITALGRKARQNVRVEIHLNDGTKLEHGRDISRGKEQFGSATEVVKKFENLAAHALPKAQVEKLRDAVLALDKLESAGEIGRLLSLS